MDAERPSLPLPAPDDEDEILYDLYSSIGGGDRDRARRLARMLLDLDKSREPE